MVGKHIVLTLLVGFVLAAAIWTHPPAAWGWIQILGLALLVVGFTMWTIARFQLGASFSVTAQARQLVTRGIYSRIRNPIYLFGSCVVAGFILFVGKPQYLLVFAIIIPLQIVRAGKESKVLEEKFGDDYRRYRAGTWF